ncbi:FAD-binding protein [Bradyrhizobium cytisi]|uniref:FAD-binding protein n=2 Tax=Bradyrhizobium cytisi TaxID=515489 RepID=A0A5S4W1Q4_9BRAD|nr:FAD-binding protein [Bradyrhizobium cytisi]
MAGLCAALTAIDQGADVVVLEKGSRVGGSMLLSHGLIWTFSDKRQLKQEIPDGNEALQELVVDGLTAGHTWLEELGVPLEPETSFEWYGRGRAADPRTMASTIMQRFGEKGGRLHLRTGMQRLLLSDDQVAGVVAFDDEGSLAVEAKSSVLATGGFQGNTGLITQYITPHADSLYLRSNPWSTGDGFLAATRAGAAATTHLNCFYGHALAAPPARFSHLDFSNLTQRYGQVAVALNLEGQRFVDESEGTGEEALNLALAAQPNATGIYVVDASIASGTGHNAYPPKVAIDRARNAGGPVVSADTLEELADKLANWSVPADIALGSLRSYNAAVREGRGRALFPSRQRNAVPLLTAPFSAVMVRAGITFTCGGLQADLDMNVLRRSLTSSTLSLTKADMDEVSLTPMANLYAAGCDLGAISTRGYLGGLATALVTGRIAGASATHNAKYNKP